jgi:hypothetical protein
MYQSEWYIGTWDPIAQLSLIQQNNSPYALVHQSSQADEIYFSLDGTQPQPWTTDSLFVGSLAPGIHSVELFAGRCGRWDTTSVDFNIVVSSVAYSQTELLTAYPNPATNQLTIDLSEKWIDAVIEVYDLRGAWISTTRSKGNRKVIIDCTLLSEGTYTLMMTEENRRAVGSFVVVK